MVNRFLLLLGSNLGDRLQQIRKATHLITQQAGRIILSSQLYETEAWGLESQPIFVNQVIVLHSPLLPLELLSVLNGIESTMGRLRTEKWAARTIDLDILYCNHEVIAVERLNIPHPQLHLRRFTLVPLCEIDPEYIHPVFFKSNQELLDLCEDQLDVKPVVLPN